MSLSRVAIFGGSGQTGTEVATSLRGRGIDAWQLSRADVAEGVTGLQVADAAYLIAPNMHPDEPGLIGRYLEMLADAGVSRVVYHSVAAPYAPPMKHHVGKAASEDLVRRSGLDWTIVQPCAYIQNFLPGPMAPDIRVPFDLDARFGMVDLRDVGDAAAVVLDGREHVGATYELGGPAQISVREAAAVATEVLGRPVSPVIESPQEWANRVAGHLSALVSQMFVDMWLYYDCYGLPAGSVTLRALLGRTPNSFADVLRRTG